MRFLGRSRVLGHIALFVCAVLVLEGCRDNPPPQAKAIQPCLGPPLTGATAGKRVQMPSAVASRHVIIVVFENKAYQEIIGAASAPCFNWLAESFGSARDMHGVAYASLPNYIAMVSGGTYGIRSNCILCEVAEDSIADQLEEARLSWKLYAEDYPSPGCFKGEGIGKYAKKHNPFIYFTDIFNDVERCRNHIVSYDDFLTDAAHDKLPNYSMVIPDLCNDMHDCSVQTGDTFLRSFAEIVFRTKAFRSGGVLVVTFDEDDGKSGNHIATLIISHDVVPGTTSDEFYDDYSLLRSTEDMFELDYLGNAGNHDTRSLFEPFVRGL